MRAGLLRHRLVIKRATTAQQADGELRETWATLATVWGSVEPLKGSELLEGRQLEATMTTRIRMRYRDGIDAKHRIEWGGHVYEVLAVAPDPTHARTLELLCQEMDPPRTA